jgi:hypothetical protein
VSISASVEVDVSALPVVDWLSVGKLTIFAALIVGAVWKVGGAAPPDAGPAYTLFGAALAIVIASTYGDPDVPAPV